MNFGSLKDESEHVKCNIKVLKDIIRQELNPEEREELVDFIKRTALAYREAEHRFLELIYQMGDQEDLTLEQTKDFISYLEELRLFEIGLIEEVDVRENPLEWMDYILSASTHTNFFENRVVDYSHNGLEGDIDYSKYISVLEERDLNI